MKYEAVNENPRVFCAYAKTPAKALERMATLLRENDIRWLSASSVNYIEDDKLFCVTIYV